MKLYEIRDQYLGLLDLADDQAWSPEIIADTLEGINAEFDDKARNCLMLVKHLEHQASAAKAEVDRLKSIQSQAEKQAEGIKEYVRTNMESIGRDRLDLGLFKVTLRAPTKVANVIDEVQIPNRFWRVIPETLQLDKRSLLDALKAGEQVEGAALADGKRALLIK